MDDQDWQEALRAGMVVDDPMAADPFSSEQPAEVEPWEPPWISEEAPVDPYEEELAAEAWPEMAADDTSEAAFNEQFGLADIAAQEAAAADDAASEAAFNEQFGLTDIAAQEAAAADSAPDTDTSQAAFDEQFGLTDIAAEEAAAQRQVGPFEKEVALQSGMSAPARAAYQAKQRAEDFEKKDQQERIANEQKLLELKEVNARYEANKARNDAWMQSVAERMRQASTRDIENDRHWNTLSGGQKAAAIIGAAIDGFLNPGGKNGMIELLNSLAKDDIESQKFEIRQERAGLEDEMSIVGRYDAMNETEYDRGVEAKLRTYGAAMASIASKYAYLERGGSAATNAVNAYKAVEAEAAKLQREVAAEKHAQAIEEAKIGVQREKVAQAEAASKRSAWVAREGQRSAERQTAARIRSAEDIAAANRDHDLAMQVLKTQPGGKSEIGLSWDDPKAMEHPDSVVIRAGKGPRKLVGFFKDPKSPLKKEMLEAAQEFPALMEDIAEIRMLQKAIGTTYGGPLADLIGDEDRARLTALTKNVQAKFRRVMSGTAVSEKEFKELLGITPGVEGYTIANRDAVWEVFQEKMAKEFDGKVAPLLIENPSFSFEKEFLPPEKTALTGATPYELANIVANPERPGGFMDTPIIERKLSLAEAMRGFEDSETDRLEVYNTIAVMEDAVESRVSALEANKRKSAADKERLKQEKQLLKGIREYESLYRPGADTHWSGSLGVDKPRIWKGMPDTLFKKRAREESERIVGGGK